jgi:hypothetical protein
MKLCLNCKSLGFWTGPYSDVTPDDSTSFWCNMAHWSLRGSRLTCTALGSCLRQAETCKDFVLDTSNRELDA